MADKISSAVLRYCINTKAFVLKLVSTVANVNWTFYLCFDIEFRRCLNYSANCHFISFQFGPILLFPALVFVCIVHCCVNLVHYCNISMRYGVQ